MKFYLASRFKYKDNVQRLCNKLEKLGHIITVKWWNEDFKLKFSEYDKVWYKNSKIEEIANRNFKGIDDCDILILVGELDYRVEPTRFKGADIELGYAYGKGKKCLILGNILRSAMYQPFLKYYTKKYLLIQYIKTLE